MGRLQQRWRLCSHPIPSPKTDEGKLEAELVGIVLYGGTKVWKCSLGKSRRGHVLLTTTPRAMRYLFNQMKQINSWETWKLCEPPPALQSSSKLVGFIWKKCNRRVQGKWY